MNPSILAIETATNICSVAVSNGANVVSLVEILRPKAHAEFLGGAIKEALVFAGITLDEIDVVAVSAGPGSYTGLRIGASMAKGLAYGTDAKLVAVSTLEALARRAADQAATGDVIVPLLSSRQNERYAAAYERGPTGALSVLIPPEAISVEGLPQYDRFDSKVWVVGEGAARFDAFADQPEEVVLLPGLTASASAVASLAAVKAQSKQYEDATEFEPRYLKEFIARQPTPIFDRLGRKLKKGATAS